MSREELLAEALVSGTVGGVIASLAFAISKMRSATLPFSHALIIGLISQQVIYWTLNLSNIQITKEG